MSKQIFIPVAIIVYAITSLLSFQIFAKSKIAGVNSGSKYSAPVQDGKTADTTGPKTEECPINGEMLTKGQKSLWEKRRPLTVMIENHEESRPQSGLTSADVVYEAVAEGGISRFVAVYYCKDSDGYVGPIRSARVYFIDFASEYGEKPLYVHVGGANCNKTTGSGCANGAPADAMGMLDRMGWTANNDLNFIPFPVMWRDYERLPGVATEHTVYSTTKKLWDYAKKERNLTEVDEDGSRWDKNFTKWKFKEDKPSSKPLTTIAFDFWEGKSDYSIAWNYSKETNSFKRLNGGQPHIDKNNNKQIESKNVIIAFMDESVANDGYQGGEHMLYDNTGSGDAIVFQDGQAVKGVWKKPTATSRIRFFDKSDKEILLNRGQTFIEIVPTGNKITY
ncbi:MAG TPA: DUF3048 domain-containing protein [Candidatus Nitrosocosmicus sp.]|nr:DUF3048 domain-containing protein [Candidatus Nitrosocosmicus sp.]